MSFYIQSNQNPDDASIKIVKYNIPATKKKELDFLNQLSNKLEIGGMSVDIEQLQEINHAVNTIENRLESKFLSGLKSTLFFTDEHKIKELIGNVREKLKKKENVLPKAEAYGEADKLAKSALEDIMFISAMMGRDFSPQEARGRALEKAVQINDQTQVSILLATEIPPNEIDVALGWATRHNNIPVIAALLTYGLPTEARTIILEKANKANPDLKQIFTLLTAPEIPSEISERANIWKSKFV